jgi:S-DNA-T family DNA segregation ATPase FtsK/SpoIIIE
MTPAPERIQLPAVAPAPARGGLPLVAMFAPLVLAVGLWIMTSSPYTLLFALLGPVVALASALDGRRTRRRTRRREVAVARERLDELEASLAPRLAARVAALAAAAPSLAVLTIDESISAWWLGLGDVPSGIELLASDEVPELAGDVERLRGIAAQLRDAPVIIDGVDEFVVTGAEPLVRAFARGLVLQAVARCAPGTARVSVPEGERWAEQLPARCTPASEWRVESEGRRVLVVRAAVMGRAVEVRLGHAGEEPYLPGETARWRPAYLGAAEAEHLARRLAALARQKGWQPPDAIPSDVELGRLLDETESAPTAAPLGRDAAGPVLVDLEQSGPHALVAGTTGAGKSELLVSWVLALAARRPPAELAFLLVDFKGGSSFAPLAVLPHVSGVVSDLDEGTATRAIESLRAELRRREAVLASHAARDIRELAAGTLPRLVIVVDEFAALIALDPELQSVFVDLAARGRSLGLHLILGTQRPSGVVRDAVLANVTVRVCLRVLEPAESSTMVGVPDAAELAAEQRGRGLLRDGSAAREVQFARADPAALTRIAERWRGHPVPEARPWLDPLPAEIALRELPAASDGLTIGLIDRPAHQRQDPLVVDPWREGALLVVGATGAGRTEALAALAAAASSAGAETRWIAGEAAELWAALTTVPSSGRTLVVVDDLDLLLARGDAELRTDLGELLTRVTRESRRIAVVASARSAGGALQAAAAAFEQRMLLRLPTREEHLVNGGEARDFRAGRRPGAALWRGHEAQVARAPARPPVWRASPVEARLGTGSWGLATPSPDRWLERFASAGVAAAPLGAACQEGVLLVGDIDSWLVEHRTLGGIRRGGRLLLHGGTRADLRALTRSRSPVPPLAGEGEAWLIEGAGIARVRMPFADEPDQARPSGGSSNSSP